jgi:DNA repair protein SbcD/Mre11
MRLLHTADWHLGRLMAQESLLADQAILVEQVFEALVETKADVLIVAGDVFDRPNPKRDAVDLFDRFLTRVYRETSAAIVVIAGNHDAPERIAFAGALQDHGRVLIRGPLNRCATPLVLEDTYGPVAISGLPFSEIYSARAHYGDAEIASPEHVLVRQLAEARAHAQEGVRWVVTAHAFVQGGAATESERSLDFIGGIETVPHTIFDGAAYVALGHLHRAQAAGAPHVCYSGSPMAFGFDEAGNQKGMQVVDLGRNGIDQISTRPFKPPRQVRVIEGLLEDLVRESATRGSQDFIKAVLTDEGELVDPMGRLRSVYPFALQIERCARRSSERPSRVIAARTRHSPLEVIGSFVVDVRGDGLSDEEEGVARAALASAMSEDD